jgi:hypothetical protein
MLCQMLTLLTQFLIEGYVLCGVNLLPEVTFGPARMVA